MRKIMPVVLVLVLVQASALAGNISEFNGGIKEAAADLVAPECRDTINISLPSECYVTKAVLNISSMLPDATHPGSPDEVQVFLNETPLWAFDGTAYGGLGLQDRLSDQKTALVLQSASAGGSINGAIRLMQGVTIEKATMELACTGPGGVSELADYSIGALGDQFGNGAAGVGDVNGDGFDDFVIGAPNVNNGTGAAYLFFGGTTIHTKPDLVFYGDIPGVHFGVAICNRCDLNDDGYDDVIIGAPSYGDIPAVVNGTVYIYYGNKNMDNVSDLVIHTGADVLGRSLSCPGDVNGDGCDDLIVGAPGHNATVDSFGAAYIFFGSKDVNTTPDVSLLGEAYCDRFGRSVAGAGDVNGDGYDDIIVGAWAPYSSYGPNNHGNAYVYYGRPVWPKTISTADVIIRGENAGDLFGNWVSGVGDVNGDGYDDVVVGANHNCYNGTNSGSAYIFYGGKNMDDMADIVLRGQSSWEEFGYPVCGIGDVNRDGYDDLMVGSAYNSLATESAGAAFVFYGGKSMDVRTDESWLGNQKGGNFGYAIANAGDINGDGINETIIGEPSISGYGIGGAHIFTRVKGILNPSFRIGSENVWSKERFFNGEASLDVTNSLVAYLQNAISSGTDEQGNSYVDVPVTLLAEGPGTFTLKNISITYNYTAPAIEFSTALNEYLFLHMDEKDSNGNLSVPIRIVSKTPGRLKLQDLDIETDMPPTLTKSIPDIEMDEGMAAPHLADLWDYFMDDFEPDDQLQYDLVSASPGNIKVAIVNNRFISADATAGPLSDNWTGTVDVVVKASDRSGLATTSNTFRIIVKNVPDPPMITSLPPLYGIVGRTYVYQTTAVDGDNDILSFYTVKKPQNMTLNSMTGRITWNPSAGGSYNVSVSAYDGIFTVFQNFTVTVLNRPPRVTNTTIPDALVGTAYTYQIPAVDDDGATLSFTLLGQIEGMAIDPSNGKISWTPTLAGIVPVMVLISDGADSIVFNFTITIQRGNQPPSIQTDPVIKAKVGHPYTYMAKASDPDGDPVTYSLVEMPMGMTIDGADGNVSWTPPAAGDFPVRIMAADANGGQGFQSFALHVDAGTKAVAANKDQVQINTAELVLIVLVAAAVGAGTTAIILRRRPQKEKDPASREKPEAKGQSFEEEE